MSNSKPFSRRIAIAGGVAAALAVPATAIAQEPGPTATAALPTTTPSASASPSAMMSPGGMMNPTPMATAGMATGMLPGKVPTVGSDVVEILENDHKNILAHLDRLQHGSPATRKATLDSLTLLFSVHNSTEENFVYPAVGALAHRPADQATLFHEQDLAKAMTWMIAQTDTNSANFAAMVAKLTTAVKAHVAMEENVDFPAVKAALGPAGTMKVTAHVRAFRAMLT